MMLNQLIDSLFPKDKVNAESKRKLIEYYSEAGPDYEGWSEDYNMHFGYYVKGINIANREALVQRMNKEVLDRLQLSPYRNNYILDMGCGLGATCRYAAGRYPIKKITGITIVPWQVEKAIELAKKNIAAYNVKFELADYEASPYCDATFDGVFALESSCHSVGEGKQKILKEIYRVTKPGGKIVIADGFLKTSKHVNPVLSFCYRKMCDYWAVDGFGNIDRVKKTMQDIGFYNIQIEDVSWNVAPSVLHVPWVSIKYLFTRLLTFKNICNRQCWHHFLAPLLALIVALHRGYFSYYIITAKK